MTALDLAHRYYEEFAGGGDFADVPMADELAFTGPVQQYVGAGRYRRDCADLAARVSSIEIRHQIVDGDCVHTVYDFDLGLPTGPIVTSETLTFRGGEMIAADLFIDSSPLRPPESAT